MVILDVYKWTQMLFYITFASNFQFNILDNKNNSFLASLNVKLLEYIILLSFNSISIVSLFRLRPFSQCNKQGKAAL